MRTTCDECQTRIVLDIEDADGVLIGGECPTCEMYVTRYLPGQAPV